jgi:hypothetical protein
VNFNDLENDDEEDKSLSNAGGSKRKKDPKNAEVEPKYLKGS